MKNCWFATPVLKMPLNSWTTHGWISFNLQKLVRSLCQKIFIISTFIITLQCCSRTMSSSKYFSLLEAETPAVSSWKILMLSPIALSWTWRMLSLSQGSKPSSSDVITLSYTFKAAYFASVHLVCTKVSHALCTLGTVPGVFKAET